MDFNNLAKMIPQIGTSTLKDLIKSIRLCKTAADERSVITKESANIRTAFKEENNQTRYINIEKLLYIHMLGYPAHFGQIECLKLAASPKFSDKRLAYLGTMLLLDENQATLTLVTNCLKNDMNNSSIYIVGLALCTLGNIASPEMSRDLSGEVERLLTNSNSYIRKKACLTALRIVRKVPDLAEHFMEQASSLINERNHGVLLTGITLLDQMCKDNQTITSALAEHVPSLCKVLKKLVNGGSSPEHDVNGITDPFLQVKILRFLCTLGKGNQVASEQMNDVLAQVASNTDASKNVGNAILYETVITIMNIESDSSLRVLAINILGRFLQNKDNNIKYVALTTLTKTSQSSLSTDVTALQRHRSTVLDCLRDPDISIRRRALDLSFYLITPANIRILTRELLSYLEVAEKEAKSSISSRICEYAGRYRPNKRWEIDTIIRVLRVAGAYVDQSVINHFVKLVTTGDKPVHQYAVTKLYNLIQPLQDLTLLQEGLLQAAFWCLGEYGHILVTESGNAFGVDEDDTDPQEPSVTPSESKVFEVVSSILKGPYATSYVMEYGINALVKLSVRFNDAVVVELALLEHMPVLESAVAEEKLKGTGAQPLESSQATKKADTSVNLLGDLEGLAIGGTDNVLNLLAPSSNLPKAQENIMDLLGGLSMANPAPVSNIAPVQAQSSANPIDLLGDLFGGGPAAKPSNPPTQSNTTNLNLMGDLNLATAAPAPAPVAANTNATLTCYQKNGLVITFQTIKESPTITQIKATFTSTVEVTNLLFQVAVPKSFKLLMQPASSSNVSPTSPAIQLMKIENSSRTQIRLRIKISYKVDAGTFDEIVEFSSFDPSLWQ